jgi:hypothetical protein
MLFLGGLICFFLSVEAVLGKESRDSDFYLVALFNVDDFRAVILLIDAFYATASANSRRRRRAFGWDGMFEVVLFAPWAHANAADVIDL